jgi:hypothetical protein
LEKASHPLNMFIIVLLGARLLIYTKKDKKALPKRLIILPSPPKVLTE